MTYEEQRDAAIERAEAAEALADQLADTLNQHGDR